MGYFYLIKQADVFVFLDHVQFERNSWQSRNRVKGPMGPIWLTVPVHHKAADSIREVKIDNSQLWSKKHLLTIKTCYGKAPFTDGYLPFFESLYKSEWASLVDLNIHVINYLSLQLGLSPVFVRSSELSVDGRRSELVLNICKALKAEHYLATIGAKEYMQQDGAELLFKKEQMTLEFIEYQAPTYPQLFGEFIPNLSMVDLLFNCGSEKAQTLLNRGKASFSSI